MTQGEVVVNVTMTKRQAENLQTILDYSHMLWEHSKATREIEKTSQDLFNALSESGIESRTDPTPK
jgi:hypothetical protein